MFKRLLFFFLLISAVGVQAQTFRADTARANRYFAVGDSLLGRGKLDTSIVVFQKALDLYRQHRQWQSCVSSLVKIARAHRNGARYDIALRIAQEALKISIKKLGKDHPETASAINSIGATYFLQGDNDNALECYQKALAIREKKLSTNHPLVAETYVNVGMIYRAKGVYEKSMFYYQNALNIYKAAYGEVHQQVAWTYNSIANMYRVQDIFDLALEYYLNALEINKKVYGEKHPLVAQNYNNIGITYYEKHLYSLAIDYYVKAIQINQALYGENHPETASAYFSMCSAYIKNKDYKTAILYLEKIVNIQVKLYKQGHSNLAATYRTLGEVYVETKDYPAAITYYQKALDIQTKVYKGTIHPEIAYTHYLVGWTYRAQQEPTKSLSAFQQSLIANSSVFRDTSIYQNPPLQNYYNQNTLLKTIKQKAEAFEQLFIQTRQQRDLVMSLQTFRLCDQLIDQIRQSRIKDEDKLFLGDMSAKIYESAIRVSSRLQQTGEENTAFADAFYFAEKSKSSVLLESIAESEAKKFAGIPDSLLAYEARLKADIALFKQKLADKPDSTQEAAYREKLFRANRENESFTARLEKQYPEYFYLKYQAQSTSVKEVQELLDDETAVLEYFVGDSAIYLFVITRQDISVKTILPDYSLQQVQSRLRNAIKYQVNDVYLNSAFQLYKDLFPADLDKNIKNLVIIPDSYLNRVPFDALLTRQVDDSNPLDYRQLPYLLRDYNISYAYSATLLYQGLHKQTAVPQRDFVAFAPVFTNGEKTTTENIERSVELERSNDFSPLPSTRKEVEQIAKLFKTKRYSYKVYLWQQAREEAIKSRELSEYRYVHIATHGFVNEQRPELSGIMMAHSVNNTEDGILYSGEIYNLRLNSELVVLSACETGLGKISRGEGILGLTRALMYAGTRNVMVSLWKVADQSTSDLMIDFYKLVLQDQAGGFATPLKEAKLKMIDEGKYAHPYYWSPFVLIGK